MASSSGKAGARLLVANVGNTNVQTAVWDGERFSGLDSRPTKGFSFDGLPAELPMAVASVAPSAGELFRERGAFMLSSSCKLPLDLSKMDVSTLGADRLANAVSLVLSGPLPALCVDFGTAITFEIVDESKALLGGAIAPGRALQRKALNSFTAKLPLTELGAKAPEMPGANTVAAIGLGVDRGAVGMTRELVEATRSLFPGRKLRVVACGGDAPFFIDAMPGFFEEGGSLFTLFGTAKAWELNR